MSNQAPVNTLTHLQIFQCLLSCCSASSCPQTRQCSGTVLVGSYPALYQHPQLWEGSCGFLSSQTHLLSFHKVLALAALPHHHLSLQNVKDQQALPQQQKVLQSALDPACSAAQASFPLMICRSACRKQFHWLLEGKGTGTLATASEKGLR